MNFYTLASKMRKQIEKNTDLKIRQKRLTWIDEDYLDKEQTCRDEARADAIRSYEKTMELGIELMLRYKEIAIEKGLIGGDNPTVKRTFMITIRPHCQRITFEQFRTEVAEFIKRKMFEKIYALSFEQKGTCEQHLGTGFHIHLIAQTTCRSKGEVLENTYSTFKHYTERNCIQVDICKNPETVKDKYLLEYESKDEHKITTKQWDTLWRERNNIEPIYNDENRQDILVKRATIKSDCGPQIIEIN